MHAQSGILMQWSRHSASLLTEQGGVYNYVGDNTEMCSSRL